MLGQTGAFVAAFLVGSAFSERSHTDATAVLELAAGVVLLVIALLQRPPYDPRDPESPARTDALFARLSRLRPRLAFGFGLPLGVGAKRLTLTILAAASVALAQLAPAEDVGLAVFYIVISTLVVTIPVTLYLVFGERGDDLIARSRAWITANEQLLAFATALAFGVLLILDGAVRLVA